MDDNENQELLPQSRLYQEAFARHGDSPAAVLWPRGRQAVRFKALTHHFKGSGFSVLDFGCGLAHLKDDLDNRFPGCRYIGADVVPEFIEAVRNKHPDATVYCIRSHSELTDQVDHVVISGTFNLVDGGSREQYLNYVYSALTHLFSLCRVSLSVNFMTDQVDFIQPGAHHVNVEAMYRFVRDKLSPRLQVDQSYMPYEFTIVVFRQSAVDRPDNIFERM